MEVRITVHADRGRTRLLDGIAERHSFGVSERVRLRLLEVIADLEVLPRKWPRIYSRRFGYVHKAVVDEHGLILYQIGDRFIEVIEITGVRSDWK